MLAKERRRLLLDEITRSGRVITSEFAARNGVSDVTVRADLDYLEERGRISRTHGGAVAAEAVGPIEAFDARIGINREAKQRIAAAAANLISGEQTLIFDSGTTVHHLAQNIPAVSGLIIYTPAIATAQQLMRIEGVDVHVLGGSLKSDWLQTVGTSRELGIKGLIADTLFLGTQGVDDDLDIVDHDAELVATKQRLIRRARRIVLLMDGSKWSTRGRLKVHSLDRIDVIISDSPPPEGMREEIAQLPVQLIIA